MSNNSRVTVLTEGNPFALIIRFAIPLILSSFFQQLYNFVDTAIVGRCLGVEALSAVGVTASLIHWYLDLPWDRRLDFAFLCLRL